MGMIREYIVNISSEAIEDVFEERPQALIRCKDCKFQVDRGRRYPECDKHFLWAEDNWFCADGERKEGR